MSSQNYYIPHDPSFRTLVTCALQVLLDRLGGGVHDMGDLCRGWLFAAAPYVGQDPSKRMVEQASPATLDDVGQVMLGIENVPPADLADQFPSFKTGSRR